MASAAFASPRMKRRKTKPRMDEATRLARAILPAGQAERGGFVAIDIANHTEADQRRMVRSGERRTIRKRSHIEKLAAQLGLDPMEAAACQWYADAHQLRYDTLGITAKYGDGGKAGGLGFDHLPSNAEQGQAAIQFAFARAGISAPLRLMFDRIVLQGWDASPQVEWLFRLAVRQLLHRVEGQVGL